MIFDRSWYNRAGVEPVLGFCTPDETERFLGLVPGTEKAMADSGILLLKYWLEVSAAEQTRRLESRIHDPRKIWKLSDLDLKSYSRWYDYSRARDAMFAATDTAWAPWYIAHTDDKKRGRLNIISHLLSQVPYKPLALPDVTLPKRQRAGGYTDPDLPLRHIPTPFSPAKPSRDYEPSEAARTLGAGGAKAVSSTSTRRYETTAVTMMISGVTAAPALEVNSNAITTAASGSRSAATMVAAITAAIAAPSGKPGRCEASRSPTVPTKIAGNTGPPRKLPIDTAHASPLHA